MPETAIKERPIIFSAPMVRALLDGRKTQTRRILSPQPHPGAVLWGSESEPSLGYFMFDGNGETFRADYPYGKVGDRLWVREAWALWDTSKYQDTPYAYEAQISYRATDPEGTEPIWIDLPDLQTVNIPASYDWRTPIFMPRWASRITLEIKEVRAERLQNISPEDAIAEGISRNYLDCPHGEPRCATYTGCFQKLWESIHGPKLPKNERSRRYKRVKRYLDNHKSWESNPWVYAIKFDVIEVKK